MTPSVPSASSVPVVSEAADSAVVTEKPVAAAVVVVVHHERTLIDALVIRVHRQRFEIEKSKDVLIGT